MELTEDYTGAISIRNQLALGTLRLEETPQAVSKEQAVNLVMMWNLLRALQADSTAAQQELEAAQAGLIANMEPAQIAAIAAMHLTTDDLNAFYTEKGLTLSTPEPGVTPQGGGVGGMSPAERESRRATAAALGTPTGGGQGQGQGSQRQTVLLDTVVELLNQRLAE
ncbi:MAG: hypothetical protein IT326_07200 [Anaerolineae bacterium]|nr:hypothetical protein [Anaerolineae bacterium]